MRRARSICASHALMRGSAASDIVSEAPAHEMFPYVEPFNVDGRRLSALEVLDALRGAISDVRVDTMLRVCSQRTFDIVPVVEGLYDLGNIAAVSRSCDGAPCAPVDVSSDATCLSASLCNAPTHL
jgi:hypothetical protein